MDDGMRIFGPEMLALNEDEHFIALTDQGGNVCSRERWAEIRKKTNSFYSRHSDKDIKQLEEDADERRRQRFVSDELLSANAKKAGYVYLLHHDGLHKIGRTKSVPNRRTQIVAKMPHEVTLIHSIKTDDMVGLEALLHERYAEKRMNGEWFALNYDDIQDIRNGEYGNG